MVEPLPTSPEDLAFMVCIPCDVLVVNTVFAAPKASVVTLLEVKVPPVTSEEVAALVEKVTDTLEAPLPVLSVT